MKTYLRWGRQGCAGWDDMTRPTNISSSIPPNMTSWQNTCLLDTNHTAVPRKQLPAHCCLPLSGLWTTWTCQQSQVPAGPTMAQRVRLEWRGHAVPNEVHRQPLFNWVLLGSQVDGAAPSVACSKRGCRIVWQRGVCLDRDWERGWQSCSKYIIYICLIKV